MFDHNHTDFLQFGCCGVNSPNDWTSTLYYLIHSALPSSCCSNITADETCEIGGPDTYDRGCFTFLHGLLIFHYQLIGSLFVVAGAVQLICVVLALWMLFYSLTTKGTTESESKVPLKTQCIQCLSKFCPCAIPKPDVPSSI